MCMRSHLSQHTCLLDGTAAMGFSIVSVPRCAGVAQCMKVDVPINDTPRPLRPTKLHHRGRASGISVATRTLRVVACSESPAMRRMPASGLEFLGHGCRRMVQDLSPSQQASALQKVGGIDWRLGETNLLCDCGPCGMDCAGDDWWHFGADVKCLLVSVLAVDVWTLAAKVAADSAVHVLSRAGFRTVRPVVAQGLLALRQEGALGGPISGTPVAALDIHHGTLTSLPSLVLCLRCSVRKRRYFASCRHSLFWGPGAPRASRPQHVGGTKTSKPGPSCSSSSAASSCSCPCSSASSSFSSCSSSSSSSCSCSCFSSSAS